MYLVLTYSNIKCKDQENFIASLDKYGYDDRYIVGEGEVWLGFMKSKITSCYNYLKSGNNISSEDIIIVTDCFDVLACGSISDLIRKYKSWNKDIVMGMEPLCSPDNCIDLEIDELLGYRYRYVNAGFYIGKCKSIIEMWNIILSYGINDDQIAIGRYVKEKYLSNGKDIRKINIGFDVNSDLVANINIGTYMDFEWDKEKDNIRRKDTKSTSCFSHFAGYRSNLGTFIDPYGRKILGNRYKPHNIDDVIFYGLKIGSKYLFYIIVSIVFIIIVSLFIYYFYL